MSKQSQTFLYGLKGLILNFYVWYLNSLMLRATIHFSCSKLLCSISKLLLGFEEGQVSSYKLLCILFKLNPIVISSKKGRILNFYVFFFVFYHLCRLRVNPCRSPNLLYFCHSIIDFFLYFFNCICRSGVGIFKYHKTLQFL